MTLFESGNVFYGWDEIERVCIFRAVNQHCLFVQSLHQVKTLNIMSTQLFVMSLNLQSRDGM